MLERFIIIEAKHATGKLTEALNDLNYTTGQTTLIKYEVYYE